MRQLRQYPWWPEAWVSSTGDSIGNDEMLEHGVFQNARRSPTGLTLEAEYKGVTYRASISRQLGEDDVILLRHILLQHYREPMSVVAALNFRFGL